MDTRQYNPEDIQLLLRLATYVRRFLWVYPYGTRAAIQRADEDLRAMMNVVERNLAIPFQEGRDGESV